MSRAKTNEPILLMVPEPELEDLRTKARKYEYLNAHVFPVVERTHQILDALNMPARENGDCHTLQTKAQWASDRIKGLTDRLQWFLGYLQAYLEETDAWENNARGWEQLQQRVKEASEYVESAPIVQF